MNTKSQDWRAGARHEAMQLLRLACERNARALWQRASASTIRITAQAMERGALEAALKYIEGLRASIASPVTNTTPKPTTPPTPPWAKEQ